MSGFVPESSGNLDPGQSADGRVDEIPRGNFMLMVHPLDWQMDSRGKLVPVVVGIGKDVGNGSVSHRGDFAQHRLEHERAGYVPIPHDILGSDRDYVDVYRNMRGKKVHRSVFETPAPGPDGKTVWSVDMNSWWKFLDLLRLRGLVKQPTVRVVRGILSQKRKLYADKEKRGPRNSTGEAVERYEREMAKLRTVMESLEAELKDSIRVYGDDVSAVDSRLDELLDAELKSAQAIETATQAIPKTRKPPVRRGPAPEKPGMVADDEDDE